MYEDEYDIDAAGIDIPGVDAALGSEHYGGEMDMYIDALRSFAAHIPAAIDALGSVSGETAREYAVNVHGLKGSCAGIGAEDVRKMAEDLEIKAKAGDVSGILAGNGKLIEEAKSLVAGIQAWLGRSL